MNFFVKLSQNKKVVVPMVVVIGLVIFSGGYFINDSRKVAKQAEEQSQTQTEEKQDDLVAVETEAKDEKEPEVEVNEDKKATTDDSSSDKKMSNDSSDEKDEDKPSYKKIDINISVSGEKVTLSFESSKSGKCTLYAKKDGSVAYQDTVTASSGKCVFDNFLTSEIDKLYACYASNDYTVKGEGYK